MRGAQATEERGQLIPLEMGPRILKPNDPAGGSAHLLLVQMLLLSVLLTSSRLVSVPLMSGLKVLYFDPS